MLEEVCSDLAPLEVTEDRAEVSCYVSATPPLVSREIITQYNSHVLTTVESWHGGDSGDQDCQEAGPDRAHGDQAQQGQSRYQVCNWANISN